MLHIPLTLYLLLIKILGIIALFWGTNSTFAAVTKTNYHYLTMVVFSEDHIQETRRRGRIEVICGSMFSGKTEELIRRLKRAKFARQRVEIFKPALDTRYSEEEVVSHDSNSIASTPIDTSASILLFSSDKDVIGIDEAQFFDEGIVEVANQLANNGIRVVIAGLDMDFLGRPFGPMPFLMATAEYVTKVHAICKTTGNLANYSMRTSSSKDLVQLGETDSYEAVSRRIFIDEVLNKK